MREIWLNGSSPSSLENSKLKYNLFVSVGFVITAFVSQCTLITFMKSKASGASSCKTVSWWGLKVASCAALESDLDRNLQP